GGGGGEVGGGGGGWGGRNLTAAGVERQIAVVGEIAVADELHAFAGLAEAERLELQQDGNDEVVVRMERGDVLDCEPRRLERLLAADFVTALGHIDQVFSTLEVGPLGIADRD